VIFHYTELIVQGWSSSIIVIFPSIKHEVHPSSSSQVPWAVSSFILKIYFCIGNKLGHKVGRLWKLLTSAVWEHPRAHAHRRMPL
jgi:hypothetical protein